jgi:hypothetical protein
VVLLALAVGAWLPAGVEIRPLAEPPTGTLDRVADGVAEGWALDPDAPAQPVTVRFFVDGPQPQATLAGEILTSIVRPDVNQSLGASGAHGFRWEIPAAWQDGLRHNLYAYAVDTADPTLLVELFESPKEFTLGSTASPAPSVGGEQPYQIGAWYFTAWSRYNDAQAVTALNLFGERDAWGGVRQHATGGDPWGIGEDFSNREPLLGFYDMAEQSVVDAHIRQAASGGLSFFAAYWYWNTDRNEEDAVSLAMHTYLTSPYKEQVPFLLAPIALGSAPMTREIWRDGLVPYMIETYMTDPAYYTTDDGRPVVIVFDSGFRTVEDNDFAAAELRRQVHDSLGIEPFLLWLYNPDHDPEYVAYVRREFGVDGYACFQLAPARPAEPYTQTVGRWPDFMQGQQGGFHIPCASTGFDRRPWYKITYGWGGEDPNSDVYNTGLSPAAFREHLVEVKAYLDAYPSQTAETLIVYAWNEWAEGGILEPNRVQGYAFLDVVTDVFGLTAMGERPQIEPTATRQPYRTPLPATTRTPVPDGPLGGAPLPGCLGGGVAAAGIALVARKRRKRGL